MSKAAHGIGGETGPRARVGDVKAILGLLVAIGIMACAVAFGPGCAHWHDDWEAKCGPQVDPLLKPCSCYDPRTPTCPPPPSDSTRLDAGQGDAR